jgi:protein ImuA
MDSTRDDISRDDTPRRELVQRLARSIQQVETADQLASRRDSRRDSRPESRPESQHSTAPPARLSNRPALATGLPDRATSPLAPPASLTPTQLGPLQQFLPGGRLPAGGLLEFVSVGPGGGGAWLALWLTLGVTGPLLLVDVEHELYPPALAGLGLDLTRTVVVRPRSRGEGLWAFEQALRTPGVGAAWCRSQLWNERIYHRLQRAAETGGGLGLISSPAQPRPPLARTEARWLIQPRGVPPSPSSRIPGDEGHQSSGRRLQIELLQCRGGTPGAVLDLELCDETGAVRVVSPVAPATAAARTARA